jgi:hypothetical protein
MNITSTEGISKSILYNIFNKLIVLVAVPYAPDYLVFSNIIQLPFFKTVEEKEREFEYEHSFAAGKTDDSGKYVEFHYLPFLIFWIVTLLIQ